MPRPKKETQEEISRAFEAHLSEFSSVRDEIIFLSNAQNQLINYTLAVIGSVITLFGIGLSLSGAIPNVFDNAPLILLLAASLISVLSLMFLEAEIRIQDLGRYIQYDIAPKVQKLIGRLTPHEYEVLKWEEARSQHSVNNFAKGILSGIKYIVACVPVLLLLIIFYSLRPSVATWTVSEKIFFWTNVFLFSLLTIGLLFVIFRDWARGKRKT